MHPIREQWVACVKNKHLNLGENYHQQTGIHVQQVQKCLFEICEFVAVLLRIHVSVTMLKRGTKPPLCNGNYTKAN